jgi:hypothetical protein
MNALLPPQKFALALQPLVTVGSNVGVDIGEGRLRAVSRLDQIRYTTECGIVIVAIEAEHPLAVSPAHRLKRC